MLSQLNHVIREFLNELSFQECTELKSYRRGDVVLFEHQVDRDLYFIESGEVCVRKNNRSDLYLGSGELIGEVSFLLGGQRTATIVASEKTQCRIIMEDKFRTWLENNIGKASLFYQSLGMNIAQRLQLNTQRESTHLLFGQESPILRQAEIIFQQLASRLQDFYLVAQAQQSEIELQIRETLKEMQTELSQTSQDKRDMFFLDENTEESLFAKNYETLHQIYRNLYQQAKSIFQEVCAYLNRFREQESRFELAKRARELFLPTLRKVRLYKELIEADFTESANLLSMLFLPQKIDSCQQALNQALLDFESFQSYKLQLLWFSQRIRELPFSEVSAITLINDITGTLFALAYPLGAPYKIDLHFFVDDVYSFGCVDVNLQNYGMVQYLPQKIQDWEHDIIEGKLLPSDQDVFLLPSVLDYIGDSLAVRMLQSLYKNLLPNGRVLLSTLSHTEDSSLVCEFLGWSTIRRTRIQLEGLLKYTGFKNIQIEEYTGTLLVVAQK